MTPPLEAFIQALRLGEGDPENYIDALTDLEAKGPANHTALGSCSFHGRQDLARRLLERGADPNGLYADERSPLFGAMDRKDLEMMRLLLDAGADANIGIPRLGHTPLHRAAFWNLLPHARLLVERGADVNLRTIAPNPDFPCDIEAGGESPLHYGAGFAGKELIAYLLEHGANPKLANNAFDLPMDWARQQGRPVPLVVMVS